jgi:predicted amidohydrolase YtcJ
MLEPYNMENVLFDGNNTGMNYFTEERVVKWMTEMQNLDNAGNGFDFIVHTIGDRAVREVLNAINSTYDPNARHRLTHVETLDFTVDLDRFSLLDITADIQVFNSSI